PLWLASVNASPAVVETLLASGANPNAALPSGETPLMTAVRAGDVQVVRLLLANGANPNARERHQGQTALMWAAAGGSPDVARVLVEFGADIRARSAVRRRRVGTELGGFNGAAAREIDKGGYTPLLFAAQQGTVETVALLLAAGADVNEIAPEGTSALVVAAHSGHGAVCALLLERGADVEAAGAGYTALHAAVLRGDVELVKRLVARGANPNRPLEKSTPARRNSADYALEFEMVGATPFWLAARYLEPAIMRVLLAAGADPLFVMKGGITPVIAAVQARRRVEPGLAADPVGDEQLVLDAVAIAVERGADVNAATGDGTTAMHVAAARGLNRVIEFLAGRGARLDSKNKKGQTPLGLASAGSGRRSAAGGDTTADLLRTLGARE
ncbi:MAG: ankyrin repeat domain-containing protein, partial [Vicinamibacterales bacterium]